MIQFGSATTRIGGLSELVHGKGGEPPPSATLLTPNGITAGAPVLGAPTISAGGGGSAVGSVDLASGDTFVDLTGFDEIILFGFETSSGEPFRFRLYEEGSLINSAGAYKDLSRLVGGSARDSQNYSSYVPLTNADGETVICGRITGLRDGLRAAFQGGGYLTSGFTAHSAVVRAGTGAVTGIDFAAATGTIYYQKIAYDEAEVFSQGFSSTETVVDISGYNSVAAVLFDVGNASATDLQLLFRYGSAGGGTPVGDLHSYGRWGSAASGAYDYNGIYITDNMDGNLTRIGVVELSGLSGTAMPAMGWCFAGSPGTGAEPGAHRSVGYRMEDTRSIVEVIFSAYIEGTSLTAGEIVGVKFNHATQDDLASADLSGTNELIIPVSGCDELHLAGEGIAASATRRIDVSVDGGATYISAAETYKNYVAARTGYGFLELDGFYLNSAITDFALHLVGLASGVPAGALGFSWATTTGLNHCGVCPSALSAVTHVRLRTSDASNFSAGTVWGKKITY